jgi:proteasome lid subunit RPN8/RPN11
VERLALPAEMAAAILAHAQAGYPAEVCGLVAGRPAPSAPPSPNPPGVEGAREAVRLYPGRNVSPTPLVAYELDVETLAQQIAFADDGLELVAIYHSHPHGPETPSPTDIARAWYPEAVYLIVSLADPGRPVLRGFRIVAAEVQEMECGVWLT